MRLSPLKYKILFFTILYLAFHLPSGAQDPLGNGRDIEIVSGARLSQVYVDQYTSLQVLAGNAVVKQGNTILQGDSIVLNPLTRIAEVFGNIHINDADSVHTYGQYLRYLGNERVAYIKRNVKLTDGKGSLYTNDLEYNLATGIASYKNGGRVVNGSTTLTSANAIYYSDTKDVYFKQYVHLTDPDYDIKADSLMYNTFFKTATFISPTRIKTRDGLINTRSGTYNLETRNAQFYDQTAYSDSTHYITGEKMGYDENAGILQIEGPTGKLVDSANKVTVLGSLILLDKKKNTFLATRKPVMILWRGQSDSTYVAADTLFSGMRKYDSSTRKTVIVKDTIYGVGTRRAAANDSIRYFMGFHNVRIFNDSLQALADSMYYSTEDSVFRLFQSPIVWNDNTQLTGDTMYLFTVKQQPTRLYVFNNSMVINESSPGLYNQVAGRTINGYFVDGSIDYIRVKGSPAESIYYPQDEDSAYVGMNNSKGDVIDIYFRLKSLYRIKFINDINGTLFPMNQIPPGKEKLKNFLWQDSRRPKNKLELFE